MTYGERLVLARIHAGFTQHELAVAVGIKQPSLAHLEKNGKGSAFTVKFARACGVSADWLDDEIGEMIPTVYSTTNPKIGSALRLMEQSADYVQEAAVTAVLTTCELAARAKANGHG